MGGRRIGAGRFVLRRGLADRRLMSVLGVSENRAVAIGVTKC